MPHRGGKAPPFRALGVERGRECLQKLWFRVPEPCNILPFLKEAGVRWGKECVLVSVRACESVCIIASLSVYRMCREYAFCLSLGK